MKTFLIIALLGVGAAVPAFAADMVTVPEQAPAPTFTTAPAASGQPFSGAYFGVTGGYGWMRARGTITGLGSATETLDGGGVSAFAGYDHQFDNNLVIGLEAQASYDWIEKRYEIGGAPVRIGTDWGGLLRGRLGYAMGDALFYTTGGLALQNVYASIPGFDGNAIIYGYTLGGGLDYAFTDRLFGRLEYRYTDYPTATTSSGTVGGYAFKTRLDLSSNVVSAGLGLKF